ncbi:MAG TPA: M1 family metallopeptidase [Kofleriaceae bacterium]
MTSRYAWLVVAACSTSVSDPVPVPVPVPVPDAVPVPVSALTPPVRLPAGATPLAYDLRLEVDPAAPHFTGHVAIRIRLDSPTDHVWLDADELDITHASFRAGPHPEPLATLATGDGVRAFGFGRTLPPGEVTLELDYTGGTAHDEQGLFRQRAGSRWYLFSQAESVYARRFVPCFDEPGFKTPWRITLDVPAHDIALSNMPQASEHALADGRREVAFAETPRQPSYLVAVAVGPFELVEAGTVGRAHVPLRVAALAGQRGRVPVAAARLPAIVDAAETLLDEPLPLAKLDLVVVPHLFGAMENPGLITFDARILVGDSAQTAREFDRVAAHELVHQWFGDLVTPGWWDDLWLAEAFATWLGERIVIQLGRSPDPALRRALSRQDALAADDDPGAPALRPKIEHAADAEDEFSAIAYDKGAAVLETIAAWQGDVTMFAALRGYLRAHRGGTATARDLYAAFDAEPARALAGLVEHPGVPVVELALRCDAKPVLAARVRGGFAVPVCARYGDASATHRTCALVADRGELVLDGGCPTWVVGNDRAAYYDVAWQTQPPLGPVPPLAQLAPGEVIAAGEDVAAGFERGEVNAADALTAIDRLAREPSPYAQLGGLAIARAIDPIVDDATRPRWSAWLARRFAYPPGDKPVDHVLRDAIAELFAPAKVDPDGALASWLGGHGSMWDWLDYFDRGATRSRAWHAVHGHLAQIVKRLGGELPTAADELGKLCDAGARAELAVALPAKDKHVVRALAAIDRCVARRARSGEVAAALR